MMLEKTLKSPLDCKEIKPVNPKWNQSWIFIGRTNAEAETPILWNWLTSGKDPDAGKDWRQEEKGTTEDEMIVWHHWLSGQEFAQALGAGDGQGSPCCMQSMSWTWLNWWTATGLSTRNTLRCRHMWWQAQEISLSCPPRRSGLYCHCPGVLAIIGRQNSAWGIDVCQKDLSSDPGLGHLLTLGKFINLSKCLFPHLQNECSDHNYFIKLCEKWM